MDELTETIEEVVATSKRKVSAESKDAVTKKPDKNPKALIQHKVISISRSASLSGVSRSKYYTIPARP